MGNEIFGIAMFLNILRFIWAWNSCVTGVEQDYLTMKFITRTEKKNCQVTFWMNELVRGCQNNFKAGLKFPFFHQSCPNICMSAQKKPILPDRLCHLGPFSNAIHWSALLHSKLHLWRRGEGYRVRRRRGMTWDGGLCAFKEKGGSGQINTSQESLSSVSPTEENIRRYWHLFIIPSICAIADDSRRLDSRV